MKQEEYRSCMTEGLKGKSGLSKQERQLLFCTQSKVCSGKASTREQAEEICRIPKPPKAPKSRIDKKPKSCNKQAMDVAQCVIDSLEASQIYQKQIMNINSAGSAIANALMECMCPK
jgi:hypothetical protein